MRATTLLRASLAVAVLVSCGKHSETTPCTPPTGCVRSGEVAGSCQCLEWEIVSIEPVPMNYMVVGIVYALLGNQSQVTYGHMPVGLNPPSSSEFGTRWRSVIRALDGSEAVAALGPIDMADLGFWPPLKPVTEESGALTYPFNGAITVGKQFDVSSREYDQIWLWVNPGAAVVTDYSGRKSIAWSTPNRDTYGGGPGPMVWTFLAGWLDGTIPMTPSTADLLPPLGAGDVASILSHDPFFAGSTAPDSATLAANPRYRKVGAASFNESAANVPPVGWSCSAPVTDASFPVLDTAEIPFGNRETLVLESTTVGVDEACVIQAPALALGSSTPGCRAEADVFVDTVFGTLLMVPTSVDAACTVAP